MDDSLGSESDVGEISVEADLPGVDMGEGDNNGQGTTTNALDSEPSDQDVMSLILAFSIRHSLSKVAIRDLLDLLHALGTTTNVPESRYKLMKSVMEEISEQKFTHFYCSACLAYVDSDADACRECKEGFSRKKALKDGQYFLYMPLHDQVKELLESGYLEREMVSRDRDEHLRDSVDGEMARQLSEAPDLSRLTINWNFDGLPIYKSSNASLWPILIQINELCPKARKEQMLMCGLWFGAKKPLWATYSKPFLKELGSLGSDGISWMRDNEPMRTTIGTLAIVCDSPARCMVQGIHQFNGAFGCTWCLHEGTVVPRGDGTTRVYEHQTEVPKRTQNNIISSAKKVVRENLIHHNGVKGATPLLLLPRGCGIDVVKSFAVDYMHAVLLGVVRQFLDLWFSSKWSSFRFSLRGNLRVADSRLLGVRPPQDLSRTPRTLRDGSHWKASECRNWLLYYSVPVLFQILPTRYMEHWCLLVSAIFILLKEKLTVAEVLRAEQKLSAFSRGVGVLYGQEHMSSNVHACLHLAESVKSFGPLWACSSFPFEGYMMKIKKFFSGTTYLPQQVANTFLMLRIIRNGVSDEQCNERVARLAQKWLGVYTRLDHATRASDNAVGLNCGRQRSLEEDERYLLEGHGIIAPQQDITAMFFDRAVVSGSICCTEEYGASLKRNSFTLLTRFGVGKVRSICFLALGEGIKECVLFLERMENIDCSVASLEHMSIVRPSNAMFLCRPCDVICNAVVVPMTVNGENVWACLEQPNAVEKD